MDLKYVQRFDNSVSSFLTKHITSNNVVSGVLHLLILLYITQLSPALPVAVLKIFGSVYFKIIVFAFILWSVKIDPSLSLLLAIAFIMSVNLANGLPVFEFLENTESGTKTDAIISSIDTLEKNKADTPMVNGVVQEQNTIVISPTIVDTANGPVVNSPNVVISPLVVQDQNGSKVVVNPSVSVIQQQDKQENSCDMYTFKSYDISKVQSVGLDSFPSYKKFKSIL